MTGTKHVKTWTQETSTANELTTDVDNDNPGRQPDTVDTVHINSSTTPPVASPSIIKPDDSVWRKKNKKFWQKANFQRRRNIDNIKPRQVAGLWDASNFATEIGRPLNMCLTLKWTTKCPETMQPKFRKGWDCTRRWLRDKNLPFHAVYCHENPGGTIDKPDAGRLNSHLFAYVPKRLLAVFEDKVEAWFPDAAARPNGIRVEWPDNRLKVLRYMHKGAPQPICRKYGGRRESGGQGYLPFKRIGWSQTLGQKARQDYSATDPYNQPDNGENGT